MEVCAQTGVRKRTEITNSQEMEKKRGGSGHLNAVIEDCSSSVQKDAIGSYGGRRIVTLRLVRPWKKRMSRVLARSRLPGLPTRGVPSQVGSSRRFRWVGFLDEEDRKQNCASANKMDSNIRGPQTAKNTFIKSKEW